MEHEIGSVSAPFTTSLNQMSILEHNITKILPIWQDLQMQDSDKIIDAIDTLQVNISWALACIQTQVWLLNVAKNIIRDGLNGIIPIELRKVIWENTTSEFERSHQAWWKMVNFSYNPETQTVTTYVFIITGTREEWMSP